VRLQEPIATSSAIDPSPERVRLQEPIVTSSAITPSPEQMCFTTEPFASSFTCAVLIFYLLSRSKNRCVFSPSHLHLRFPVLY
jgi:hypothetical protein